MRATGRSACGDLIAALGRGARSRLCRTRHVEDRHAEDLPRQRQQLLSTGIVKLAKLAADQAVTVRRSAGRVRRSCRRGQRTRSRQGKFRWWRAGAAVYLRAGRQPHHGDDQVRQSQIRRPPADRAADGDCLRHLAAAVARGAEGADADGRAGEPPGRPLHRHRPFAEPACGAVQRDAFGRATTT